jgi:hypothetical protein
VPWPAAQREEPQAPSHGSSRLTDRLLQLGWDRSAFDADDLMVYEMLGVISGHLRHKHLGTLGAPARMRMFNRAPRAVSSSRDARWSWRLRC